MLFNIFKRKKAPERVTQRQQQKTFVTKETEQFARDIAKRSLGLGNDRLDGDTARQVALHGTINSALKGSAKRLFDQGRGLVHNTSIGARYAQYTVDNVVGTGLDPKPLVRRGEKLDKKTNAEVEKVFWRWALNKKLFSVNGKLNFRGLLVLAERERVAGGECFIVIRRDRQNMKVELLPADRCDWTFCRRESEDRVIYQGIEYEESTMTPVAYWFRKVDVLTQSYSTNHYRVEAKDVLHYYAPSTSDALRGMTDFTPVIKDIAHQDAFTETAIIQKRVAASTMGFIENTGGQTDSFDLGEDEYQEPDIIHDFAPGTIQELGAGKTIKTLSASQQGDDFDKFSQVMLTNVAMGLNVFKQGLTGDTSQINYSSARFGDLTQRNRFKGIQTRMIEDVVMPLFEEYLRFCVLTGQTSLRMTQIPLIVAETKVIRPRVDSVDPQKDANTDVLLIKEGLKPRSQVIMERGDDPEQVLAAIQAENAALNTSTSETATENEPPQTP